MAHLRLHPSVTSMSRMTPKRASRLAGLAAIVVAMCAAVGLNTTTARADAVAYLVNVTVRPGYNFPNAQAALDYGYSVCDDVLRGRAYGVIVEDINSHFATSDVYQATYLISQAINELCPAQIWQLRNLAAQWPSSSP
jgi:hypothetical protein